MNKYEILKAIDAECERANNRWHQMESMKMRVAKNMGISNETLRRWGFYTTVETAEIKEVGWT